jgi:hypothetical protein
MWMTSGDYILPSECTNITGGEDHTSCQEGRNSMQKVERDAAMKEETDALVENDTWEFVDCPKNVKVIDNHWVLLTKRNADGLTKQFRARLVAKGHVQKVGVDYNQTFSPEARYDTVRAVLAVAAMGRLQICKFDVKTAFLYMHQPEGFDDGSGWNCKLKRNL